MVRNMLYGRRLIRQNSVKRILGGQKLFQHLRGWSLERAIRNLWPLMKEI